MVIGLLAAAWATEPDEVVVVGEPEAVDAGPARVTVIEVADLPAAADLAAAVERAPGVVVRRLGGVGDLAQIGIRGAGARQAEILLDGIPLNPEGGSAVDLSELPLSAFERVEVYRGAAPALLGTTALGGAVALVPSSADVARSTLSVGSFGTGRASATAGGSTPAGRLLLNLDGLTTDGTFRFWDDRGTRSVPDDDRIAVRENNDTHRLSALVTGSTEVAGARVVGLYAGLVRDEGVPGFVSSPSPTVRYGVQRHLGGLRVSSAFGATALGGRGFVVDRTERLSDPNGEIGVGAQDTHDQSISTGADAWIRVPLGPGVRLDGGVGGRVDHFASTDRLHEVVEPVRGRSVVKGVASVPVAAGIVQVVPSVVVLGLTDRQDPESARAIVLPRAGGVLRTDRVALAANLGAFARPPDLVELYGDRGALVGNSELRPEQGLQVDLGPTFRGERGRLEIVGFLARYRDLIAWTVGAQGAARPENVDRADVLGLEIAGDLARGPVRLGVTATVMDARNRSDDPGYAGNRLPRVPLAEGLGRVGLDRSWVRLDLDGSFTAGTFADTANLVPQPARVYLGSTLELRPTRQVAVELDARNLLDTVAARVPRDPLVDDGVWARTAVVDFTGYPLPGRTLTLTARLEPRGQNAK